MSAGPGDPGSDPCPDQRAGGSDSEGRRPRTHTSTQKHARTHSQTHGAHSCVCQVLLALGDYMNVQCHACIGGTNVGEDIRKLDYGQHVVAGTPGRVFGQSCSLSGWGGGGL